MPEHNPDIPDPRDTDSLRELLETLLQRYHRPSFVTADPLSIPHRYQQKEDIELSGFFAALLAWGNRKSVCASALRLMALMDDAPAHFVREHSAQDRRRLGTFVHRTFSGRDLGYFLQVLQRIYRHQGGLEGLIAGAVQPSDAHVGAGLRALYGAFFGPGTRFPAGSSRHLPHIDRGSAAKRMNMYLRWMVRRDSQGLDFGLWSGIHPRQLICPLDVHSGRSARALGLLTRKANDWQAALMLTQALRALDPEDPVRYDIALFSLGVDPELRTARTRTRLGV